jgi:signal transduction histidine kinase/ActR/RegA family two-component response regulator
VSRSVPAYACAVAAVAGAAGLVLALGPLAVPGAVTPLFFAAVVVASVFGGRGPGLLATALSIVLTEAVFFAPMFDDVAAVVRGAAFAVVCLLTASLAARAEAARRRAESLARSREELLRAEQAARADAETAGRAKDEFLSTLSHELRTPLNALMGWVWWLRRGDLDADKEARALATIERSTNTLAQLIEDLLDVSRIITGRLRLSIRPVAPGPSVSAAVEAVRPAAEAKAIALSVDVDEQIGPVLADPDRLQQILWNLVSNAVKFTPDKGRIDVSLRREASDVVIRVRDTGHGIGPELLPHIFERFRQGQSRRLHPGLGLGLSIVRHLVEVHGGRIEAESPGEGRGATFTVTLPLRTEPTAHAVTLGPPVPVLGPRLDGLSVLVVEDDADSRVWLKGVLEDLGADVLIASSVQEALDTFQREGPGVLVSDIRLPDGDGYELLARVRAADARAGRHTPAVALTAYPRVEDRARALEAGFEMHVPKPVSPEDLASVLGALVARGGGA